MQANYPRVRSLDDPEYPSRDGKPMADNTRQYDWIVAIRAGLDDLFRADAAVFIAGNLLWYPVEGVPKTRLAPDVLVAFGRPKGDRGSYIQHREEGIAPQVVFEILSPGNRAGEMRRKLAVYETYGVEEYYVLDPDFARHKGYRRAGGKLVPVLDFFGWTSPLLGIRFDMTDRMIGELKIFTPAGRPFEFVQKVFEQRDAHQRRADEEAERADEATRRTDEATRRAEQERLRVERLLAQLRALGMEPEA